MNRSTRFLIPLVLLLPCSGLSQQTPAASSAERQGGYLENYIRPDTAANGYPFHRPYQFIHRMSGRTMLNDQFFGLSIIGSVEHGGVNMDTQQMNYSALDINLTSNTDGQIGGVFNVNATHYGHGDLVGHSDNYLCTGTSRGNDEGCELLRMLAGFHANVWGITIAAISTNAKGEVAFSAQRVGKTPIASPHHDLAASAENAPIIDTNPAKTYSAGNVLVIGACPAPITDTAHYVCVTGDGATNWSRNYGATGVTTLLSTLAANPHNENTDAFAKGPICAKVNVRDASIFSAGKQFTISVPEDRFEQPTTLAVDREANTITACFNRPHYPGEMMTAGPAVGHAFSFTADDKAPGAIFEGNGNVNQTTYRMVFPILAVLPGNIIVTWMNPANQQNILQTRALANAHPAATLDATPVLANGSIADWKITSYGSADTLTPNFFGGSNRVPPPAISFAGSTCRSLPSARAVVNRQGSGWTPATLNPGSGCTHLVTTSQSVYPNPYAIYPMAWARSNLDPDFVTVPGHNPAIDQQSNSIITASTDGYMLVGGAQPGTATDGFAVGDPIEATYNGRQTMTSQVWHQRWVMNPGENGDVEIHHAVGFGLGNAILAAENNEPASTYYGTPASGFAPDGAGQGVTSPTSGVAIKGSQLTDIRIDSPPRDIPGRDEGSVISIACIDRAHPCAHGNVARYNLFKIVEANNSQFYLNFDPATGRIGTRSNGYSSPGFFGIPVGGLPKSSAPEDAVRRDEVYGANLPTLTIVTSRGTPASSGGPCTPNASWDDDNYHYHCVSAGNQIKRSALSTF